MRSSTEWLRSPTLADKFSSRANAAGFLRLALASSVLVSHSWPLGLGRQTPGLFLTRGQTHLGSLAVDGFFVLSGFLITASGLRFTVGRFAWHRFLRIFPGLWVCLLVTALVIAPGVAMYERGTLAGFWNATKGPLLYLLADWWSGMRQYSISGLLSSTPYGRVTPGGGAFDGSLWTLVYAITCYVLVGSLVFAGALKRAPRVVVLLAVLAYLVILDDYLSVPGLASGPRPHGVLGELPLIGFLGGQLLIYWGFLFLLGMVAQLYKHRIPVHPVLVGIAGLALVGSMVFGGFFVIGQPAFAYLLLWAAAVLPKWLHGVGRKRDYSYGVYLYAFPVQQVVVLVGGARYGVLGYIVLSAIGTMVLSVASWHLIERPAMSLKDVRLTSPRKRVPAPTDAPEPGAGETIAPRDDPATLSSTI